MNVQRGMLTFCIYNTPATVDSATTGGHQFTLPLVVGTSLVLLIDIHLRPERKHNSFGLKFLLMIIFCQHSGSLNLHYLVI